MKKIFAFFVLAALFISNLAIAQTYTPVSDFNDTISHWSRTFDRNLKGYCSIFGYTDSSGKLLNIYKPDSNITRAELVKMVMQCKNGTDFAYDNNSSFPDVALTSWASPYIYTAKVNGLIQGYVDGTFHPDAKIARADALKIILFSKYQDSEIPTVSGSLFKDVSASVWYNKFIVFAVNNKFVSGYADGTFKPENSITRAEAAKIINLVYGYDLSSQPAQDLPTTAASGSSVIAGCSIFPADNTWNQDVSSLPLHSNSANFINSIGLDRHLHPDFGSFAEYGIPFTTADSSTPKVQVNAEYADESDFGLAPIPANPPIEGTASSDGDRHVLVLDKSDCTLYEMWSSYFQNGVWNVGSAAKFDLKSNTLRPDGWTSADAAGLPVLPGLIRYDEVKSGRINHAIRMTVSHTQKGYIHPATHFASSSTDTNLPPMGLRLRLKANYDISTYTGDSKVILEAMKKYGMIVADNGSSWYFSGEANSNWNDDDLNQLKNVPGSAFEVVDTGPIIN